MTRQKTSILWVAFFALSFSAARAQAPQSIVQQVVDDERTANRNDHSNWIYLEDIRKPKVHIVQLVSATQQGDVDRILEKDSQRLSIAQQRDLIQSYLHDTHAQKKKLAENQHDNQQVDDLLQLLPTAFRWTQMSATTVDTTLHFEPAPSFHPPTREARVFAAMAGDLVVDNQQHRIRSMNGHLIHDVIFGAGLIGRLKEGSSFSLQQTQVGESLWQLTTLHVHLEGTAILFKSISLQQDYDRSHFELAPPILTLEQSEDLLMKQP